MSFDRKKRARFDAILSQSLRAAEARVPDTLALLGIAINPRPIRLSVIDGTALDAWDQEWNRIPTFARGGFDWRRDLGIRQHDSAPFHVAVWYGGTLCGLGLGRMRGNHVDLEEMEGCPDPAHPLKAAVRFCIMEAAQAFAEAAGAALLRLIDPEPALLPHYQAMRFTVVTPRNGSIYCERKV